MIIERIVLSLKSLELVLKRKKKVNMYNNYDCEHDELLLYQNKKEKVKIIWIIINRDSKKNSLIIEITRISFFSLKEKKDNKYNNHTCEHNEHLL